MRCWTSTASALLDGYLRWLEARPLAVRSREAHPLRRYLACLGDRSSVDGDPLAEAEARDWVVRGYARHSKAVQGWTPAPVNVALAAFDSFYTQLGLGRPIVRREGLPKNSRAAAIATTPAGVAPLAVQVRRALMQGDAARAT